MENTLSIPVALLAQGSIRIDGITYYRHGNKVRACKSRRSPKKTRTEGEEESSSRFTEARKMWRIYRRAIGDLPIWKLMAKEMGINKSDSLFHSQNGGCFRPGEGVWAFPTFRFSTGTLDAPVITGVTREGWSVTLNWENDIDCPKASVSDQVYVGYLMFYSILGFGYPLVFSNSNFVSLTFQFYETYYIDCDRFCDLRNVVSNSGKRIRHEFSF